MKPAKNRSKKAPKSTRPKKGGGSAASTNKRRAPKAPAKPIPKAPPKEIVASGLHPRSVHRGRYDFSVLCRALPKLRPFTFKSPKGDLTIDFADPAAVFYLNAALLAAHYGVQHYELPEGALTPPVPGRADYLHRMADLIYSPKGADPAKPKDQQQVRLLDIGSGASGIYCLLAASIYGWECVGSEINHESLVNASQIAEANSGLAKLVSFREQLGTQIFSGVVNTSEYFDLTVCNPPFHASLEEATRASQSKRAGLALSQHQNGLADTKAGEIDAAETETGNTDAAETSRTNPNQAPANFGGQRSELWIEGGELGFLTQMINESREFAAQVGWFSSLVSKAENVGPLKTHMREVGATEVVELPMAQGNKITRVLAWRF
jgi:23S rRNA (adenine1618-N6)-methyltransferase